MRIPPIPLLGRSILLVLSGLDAPPDHPPPPGSIEAQLRAEDVEALGRAARQRGDAARGARVFYRTEMACASCHDPGDTKARVGPDLAERRPDSTDAQMVASVLEPSASIAEGYRTVTIAMADGRTVAGLLVEDTPGAIVLREPAGGELIRVGRDDLEEMAGSPVSLMPAGLVNALGSRQEFLDLIRYLREIADGGPSRREALRPDPAEIAPAPPADYETDIDHAGLIAALDGESFRRGEATYNRVCVACHGTPDRPGSLPTAPNFAADPLKNGADPYGLYRTLTHGFGQMAPQPGLVPRQKYDVIHFVREAFLKRSAAGQYAPVDRAYLAGLPDGSSSGPEPSLAEPWRTMDYGPTLAATYEVGDDGTNFAHKGIAVRLDPGPGGIAKGRAWALYDHDTMRLAAFWTGEGFIDWRGINFDGQHQAHPRVVGAVQVANPTGPGWADPRQGGFADPRLVGRDGLRYGPMPRGWMSYRGLYHHGDRVILSSEVGGTAILESPGIDGTGPTPVLARALEIGPREHELILQVARRPEGEADLTTWERPGMGPVTVLGDGPAIVASVSPVIPGAEWSATVEGDLRLTIPAGPESLAAVLRVGRAGRGEEIAPMVVALAREIAAPDLSALTVGGPPRWPEPLTTHGTVGRRDGPFAVDVLTHPEENPWACQMRFTGFDFFPDGRRLAACTWDGDVWVIEGIDRPEEGLSWRRIASGLFQPLGLVIRDGRIFVGCRDQIATLDDQNGDGEADFIACFNSDHQVTEHFHEFAMDLQADAEGNFYYAKGARHALPALVPQHGTLLRVARDGSRTDILATGFRAPNGVCLNDDGTFFMTDQEGHWIPKNRVNLVKIGGFYGNMMGFHDVTDPSDAAMEPPVCWITNAFDRSPSQVVRVPGSGWGPLGGSLLSLSYGYGKLFVVPYETVEGLSQGGMSPLPIADLPTGLIRGRFDPEGGGLFACGMVAWASSRTQPGGFYRIRPTGNPSFLPIGLNARRGGLAITFSDPLDRASASDPSHYGVTVWSLKRTANYGSEHLDETPLHVASARLSDDGRTVTLGLPDLRPTMGMEVRCELTGENGEAVPRVIHNTIHRLPE